MKTLKVIKIGGKLIDDSVAMESFMQDFKAIKEAKILIHGGGNLASSMARDLNIPVKQIDGRRITDDATLDIITMAYAGKINKNLVAQLQALGCNALGLTGADGNSIKSKIRDKNPIDFGHVGDPENVNTDFIQLLLDNGITPVFCAITHDGIGQLLNTNADTVAADVCSAFAKAYSTQLYYCFEKQGVLRDVNDSDSLVKSIDKNEYEKLKSEKVIADGMLPKMQNSIRALDNGVSSVHIGLASMISNSDDHHTTLTL
ncbi:N-acetylglutamate kinase [Nonlabens sp. Hel1_33_55]|uniref:acetylglutamate kinase n=1 Tax=Nonlabens sp. Hel1_33_55 TaxID=1336802 RepID=UPI000875D901|nr:acetylglutamate kinase [Nonlabens sp. Hel1_33_55]SCY04099.1 N-acetylglutamate kinase [Nonlabens sp. Hel1_33_55]